MKNNFLLDADETVLDFIRSSKQSFQAAMDELGETQAAERYDDFKVINDGLWREYERGEICKKDLMTARFSRFFARLHSGADAIEANRLYFTKLCRTGYLLSGASEFMQELKQRGRLYLITNGTPAAQYGRLESLGLTGFFDGVFVSDEIGYAKPDVHFFEFVLAAAGVKKQDCLVIGDSLTSDIKGANASGIESIWYNPKGKAAFGARPDHIADSYLGILEIVDSMR